MLCVALICRWSRLDGTHCALRPDNRSVMSLGATRGLLRHYWVLAKFLITAIASVILFMCTQRH